MMLLNELTLRRFRIHEQLTIPFAPGVTGIVGRNGTGKSSIIEAIGFLFTGEGEDTKDQIITAGQSGASFVRGRFTLNGKVGVLERALDSSRVLLEYDGQKLVKAGEVKELWAKLLQIDPHIFNHVIMARQKRVPELFSGDQAVREKAFQRIFMVPNTERLRGIIWDNYIKTCPPPLPEDDIHAIDLQCARLKIALAPKEEKRAILEASVLNDQQMAAVIGYTDLYRKCIQDAERRPQLESQLAVLKATRDEVAAKCQEIGVFLHSLPSDFNQRVAQMENDQHRWRNYMRLQATAAEYNKQLMALGNETLAQLSATVADTVALIDAHKQDQAVLLAQQTIAAEELKHLEKLHGQAVCPTCHQPVTNPEHRIAELQETLRTVEQKIQATTQAITAHTANFEAAKNRLTTYQLTAAKVSTVMEQAAEAFFEFNESECQAVLQQSAEVARVLTNLQGYQNTLVQTEANISVLQAQIDHLVSYTGNSTPAEELSVMQEVLQRHRSRVNDILQLEKEIAQLRTEIAILEERRTISHNNHERNLARTAYGNKLRMAYDALHTSQFPRRLIQTYSQVVEEELQLQLQRFELPYQAQINEEFRIVVTKDGHVLPRLSGGQEMVVGLCLRLALHSMFSQAFPMLIIDEGTTHLDEENKKLYFQCIRDLKADNSIQQLIIIDHSSALVDAVDHVIRL